MSLRSLEFHIVEAITNTRRNGLMTISAVTNAAACLFVLGAFFLAGWDLARYHEHLTSETLIRIFMRNGVTTAETEEFAADLESRFGDTIGATRVISPDEALEWIANETSIPIEGLEGKNPLPAAIEVRLSRPEEYQAIVVAATDAENVDEVRAGQQVLRNLLALRRLGLQVGIAMLVLLGAGALLTIGNTIRLTIYARRREIHIMQLVGATQAFIKAPFILEGMFHGFAGAALGGGLLMVGYVNLYSWVGSGEASLQFLEGLLSVGSPVELGLCWAGLAVAGCFFGMLGSWLSLSRYLRT